MNVDVASLITRIMSESRSVPKAEKTPETSAQEPAAKFTPSPAQQLMHQVYTAKGSLFKLGQFSMNQQLAKTASTLEKTVFMGKELANPIIPPFSLNETVGATLLQQIFDFVKQNLKLKDQKKRKKKNHDLEFSNEAEQRAKDLLEHFLELAEEAEDIFAFSVWARQRIQTIEKELRERVPNLPPEIARSFSIISDAIMALEHGVSPSYILERLEQEIERKSKL